MPDHLVVRGRSIAPGRIAGVAAIALLARVGVAAPLPAEHAPPATATRPAEIAGATGTPPAYGLEHARVWIDTLMPLVEEVAGRRFVRRPEARIVDEDELMEVMVLDEMRQRRAIDPDAVPAALESAVRFEVRQRAESALAYTSPDTGVILLPAAHAAPALRRAGFEAARVEPIMHLTMVHALAHALHAQHIDVAAQRAAVRTDDEALALEATWQGFAMLVRELVAPRTSAADAGEEWMRLMALGPDDAVAATAQRRRYEATGLAGWAFFRAQCAEGGMTRVWSILAAPPPVHRQIRNPQTFGDPVAMELSTKRLFAGVPALFGERTWERASLAVPPNQIGHTFAPVRRAVEKEVTANVRSAHTLVLAARDEGAPIVRSVSLLVLADAAFGPKLLEHMAALKDHHFAQVRAVSDATFIAAQPPTTPVPGFTAETSRLDRLTLRAPSAPPGGPAGAAAAPEPVMLVLAMANRGDYSAQLVANGAEVTDEAIGRALATVLERAVSGSALVPVVGE